MRPQYDQQTAQAMDRLRNSPDYRMYLLYLEKQLLPAIQLQLENAPSEAVGQLQGRARQVREIIKF